MRLFRRARRPAGVPRVALFSGGDRFEDFFDKIGVSLDEFRDSHSGGWLFTLIDSLRAEGIESELFLCSARVTETVHFTQRASSVPVCVMPSPRIHTRARNFQRRRYPTSKSLVALTSYLSFPLPELARELRRHEVTALLCQEYESPRFDVLVLLGRVMRLPALATFQGADAPASGIERPVRWLAMRLCRGLLIGPGAEVQRVRRAYGLSQAKIAHLPNAVDPTVWRHMDRAAARSELDIPRDARVVAWHGRVQIERKGLDILLDAWERLQETVPYSWLLLIGTGRDAKTLGARLASGPFERVLWIDRYVHEERLMARYLSAADVYVLPSRHEGFAVALLEAMSLSLPVIAADVPGVSDVLQDGEVSGGAVVPAGNADALFDLLVSFLGDPLKIEEVGRRARARIEDRYTVEVVGRELAAFLRARDVV
jgi:glycosyltransferase involved in cell wall biosynthesis